MRSKLWLVFVGLVLTSIIAACGNNEDNTTENNINETTGNNYSEELDYTIIGIEPGAGAMGLTSDALEEYDNLNGWTLLDSSTDGMLIELGKAMDNEEPIVIVGWNPHWKFASYDLKYLEDPKGVFGEVESINTSVRTDLQEDMPDAYEIFDRFYWEPEDMESVMYAARESSFEEAAKEWVEGNQDKVNEWTEGIEKAEDEDIEIIATPWDSELASGEVMKVVLEQQGYQVTITPVDPAIMFQAIATDEGDVSFAPWLPVTHGAFYEEYEGGFIDLGENLIGAKIGLVVPEYMDIGSIEDLQPKK